MRLHGTYSAGKKSILQSWDLYAMHRDNILRNSLRSADRKKLNELKKEHDWRIDVDDLLSEDYEALVLTDINENVKWVSKGFITMTGFELEDVFDKNKEIFLGNDTTEASRQFINAKIKEEERFVASLTNYRKNGEEYTCELNFIPIKNNENNFSHFLVLENEISKS